jgi:type II secretory pathway pseudopilin PulG
MYRDRHDGTGQMNSCPCTKRGLRNHSLRKRGFTIIELLIVIAII